MKKSRCKSKNVLVRGEMGTKGRKNKTYNVQTIKKMERCHKGKKDYDCVDKQKDGKCRRDKKRACIHIKSDP